MVVGGGGTRGSGVRVSMTAFKWLFNVYVINVIIETQNK